MTIQPPDLGKYPFFEDLDAASLYVLALKTEFLLFNNRDIIFKSGQAANSLYIIQSGSVQLLTDKLHSGQDEAPSPCVIRTLDAGETFGWSCLVPPHEWRMDAEAEHRTELLVIDGEALRRECEEHPRFGFKIIKRLSQLMLDRLYAVKFQLSMHNGKPYTTAEGA